KKAGPRHSPSQISWQRCEPQRRAPSSHRARHSESRHVEGPFPPPLIDPVDPAHTPSILLGFFNRNESEYTGFWPASGWLTALGLSSAGAFVALAALTPARRSVDLR